MDLQFRVDEVTSLPAELAVTAPDGSTVGYRPGVLYRSRMRLVSITVAGNQIPGDGLLEVNLHESPPWQQGSTLTLSQPMPEPVQEPGPVPEVVAEEPQQ